MPSKPFSWLHLTAFHFGLKGQNFLWPNLRQPFLDDLEKLHQQTGPWQAVLFTGDFACTIECGEQKHRRPEHDIFTAARRLGCTIDPKIRKQKIGPWRASGPIRQTEFIIYKKRLTRYAANYRQQKSVLPATFVLPTGIAGFTHKK